MSIEQKVFVLETLSYQNEQIVQPGQCELRTPIEIIRRRANEAEKYSVSVDAVVSADPNDIAGKIIFEQNGKTLEEHILNSENPYWAERIRDSDPVTMMIWQYRKAA